MKTFQNISVLVPTRKRLSFLSRMLESFNETVVNPEQAEIVFRCDNDDKETIDFLSHTNHKIVVGPRYQGYKSLQAFFNDMARIAWGDLFLRCNDDAVFMTHNWPAIILEEADKYPDGIFNFGVNTGLNDFKFPFSLVSRKLVDILGFLNDERLLSGDIFLLDLAKHFNRAIRIPSVTIFHDWAGYCPDETRKEAHLQELEVKFKDRKGNWSDAYKTLYDSAVNESLNKIKSQTEILPEIAINSFLNYQPPDNLEPGAIWPPSIAVNNWSDEREPNSILGAKKEIRALLRIIYQENLDHGEILVSNFRNGLPNKLWENVFDKVISIYPSSSSRDPILDDKHAILFGAVGDSKFLYSIMNHITNLKAIILDEDYYAHIIAPYFLFKRLITPPGIIVFFNNGSKASERYSADRCINDLRSGFLDNRRHNIIDLERYPDGSGVSYELIQTKGDMP